MGAEWTQLKRQLTPEEIAQHKAENKRRAEHARRERDEHVARGYCEADVRVYIGQRLPTWKLCEKRWKDVKQGKHLCHIHLQRKYE